MRANSFQHPLPLFYLYIIHISRMFPRYVITAINSISISSSPPKLSDMNKGFSKQQSCSREDKQTTGHALNQMGWFHLHCHENGYPETTMYISNTPDAFRAAHI